MKRLAPIFNDIITAIILVPFIAVCSTSEAATPAVGASEGSSAMLKTDGTVWTWGKNEKGQLGNKSTAAWSISPVQPGITDVTAIAVGDAHMLALKSDKSVWSWGKNESGQLGNNKTVNTDRPVQVSGLSDVIAIAAGLYNSAAIKSDGTLWTWGLNAYGQLGIGSFVDAKVPKQVTGLTNVTAVAVGSNHMLALKADGTVWAWGLNNFGQLGNGTYTLSSQPVQVLLSDQPGVITYLTGVTSISCGSNYSLAVAGGAIRGWGDGAKGQLGNGVGAGRVYGYYYPEWTVASVDIVTADPVITAAPSPAPTATTTQTSSTKTLTDTSIIKTDTTVVTTSTETTTTTTTTTMPILFNVAAVSAGRVHTMARMQDGSVLAWGFNGGRLGNSTPDSTAVSDTSTPVAVTGLTGTTTLIAAVSTASEHTIALSSDGTVWAWGDNESGQLGNGSTLNYSFPVQVTGFDGKAFLDSNQATTATPTTTPTTTPATTTASCPTATIGDADRIFNWAESKYADLFYPPAISVDGEGYRYRYYSSTNAYLGYRDGTVFHYAPAKWDAVLSLGRSCYFLNQAQAAGF